MDVDEHDHDHKEHLPCYRVSYIIIQVAFSLYHKSNNWTKHTNILFSPLSIFASSLMLSLGAKKNTHDQILEGLNFNLTETPENLIHECFQQLTYIFHQPDHKEQLAMDSSLFIDKNLKLKDRFVEDVNSLYHSKVIALNFNDTQRAQNQINAYVERETQGKIAGFVKEMEADTAFALMNYIFFQGKWYDDFEVEHIAEQDFYVNSDMTVRVPMVHRRGRFFLYRELDLSSWVMVQHYMGDATVFFMLPDQGKMWELEETLNQRHFENSLQLIDLRTADLYFPRLSITTTYDLKTILGTLGITKIFSNEADLSGVTQDALLKLDKAVHKAVLTFGDEVTEAAWNTSWSKRDVPQNLSIHFNRPFIFVIKDEYTNCPLFVGKVVNPTTND
ncbi:alpha-1-antitrypsin-like [Grammomys surdaster]|uniref:alpha-1-antitrypsin-like n=1 Tax=Grammomys surdaster TaxID=491861 RepID=UPI00109F0712|nr:alpha-1-antitrypsin-like [Grammomys surdaster]